MKTKKELPVIALVLLPFGYLAMIWNQLPQQVPMHFNLQGEVDRYGDRTELLSIPFLLPFLTYVIFLVVPYIDPKKQIQKMGSKYQSLKFSLTGIMSLLALYILYSAKNQSLASGNLVFLVIGLLYLVLGNYFKTIKPNYFIGIRTPWTLESESVWKQTHGWAGKLWFVGGLLVIICSLLLEENRNFQAFMAITLILAVVPMGHSYLLHRKEKESDPSD